MVSLHDVLVAVIFVVDDEADCNQPDSLSEDAKHLSRYQALIF